MVSNRSPTEFLERLAESVENRLSSETTRLTVHHGSDYAEEEDPDASALRRSGMHFRWVAFAYEPHNMWDVHVGVLLEGNTAIAGFHVHERVVSDDPPEVSDVATELGLAYRYSEAANEHQFNQEPVPYESGLDELASDVTRIYRAFLPLVDDLFEPE